MYQQFRLQSSAKILQTRTSHKKRFEESYHRPLALTHTGAPNRRVGRRVRETRHSLKSFKRTTKRSQHLSVRKQTTQRNILSPPRATYKRNKHIKDFLVHAKSNTSTVPTISPCSENRCDTFKHIQTQHCICSTVTGYTYKIETLSS